MLNVARSSASERSAGVLRDEEDISIVGGEGMTRGGLVEGLWRL